MAKPVSVPPVMTQPDPPPMPAPQPAPQAVETPAPKAAPANLHGFWPDLVHALHGKVPAGEYSFLSNAKMVQGAIDGPLLKLWTQNDFVRSMINKPGIVAAVAEQAKLLPGGPYRVTVVVGVPPAPQAAGHTPPPAPQAQAYVTPPAPAAQQAAPQLAPEAPSVPEAVEDDPLDSLLAMGDEFGDIITEED